MLTFATFNDFPQQHRFPLQLATMKLLLKMLCTWKIIFERHISDIFV